MHEFETYGRNLWIVALATVLSIIPFISFGGLLVAFIFLMISLANLKRINVQLNNNYLVENRSKLISAKVLQIISPIIIAIGIAPIVIRFLPVGYSLPIEFFPSGHFPFYISSDLVFLSLGGSILLVGFILWMGARKNLKLFFQEDAMIIPEYQRRDLVDACSKLRTGALMFALGFLGVTLIIGFILQVIGYFKLGKLKEVMILSQASQKVAEKAQEPVGNASMMKEKTIEYKDPSKAQFCSNCGAKVNPIGKFCAECGSAIN
jgi:hypothetical protein